jgi:hypothetical protein
VLVRNLIPGRHWSRFQPALALRGAPLQLKLTDRGRLVALIARGWAPSSRPRVFGLGGGAGRGFEPLVAWGPEHRPGVRSAAEAFPGRSPGHFNRPDRQFLGPDQDLSELIAIEPRDGPPLVVWCPDEALGVLRDWSSNHARPPETPQDDHAQVASDPFPPKRSPDGRIEVRFDAYEVRMSHWILEPIVIRTRDGATVLSLEGSGWDGGGRTPSFPSRDRAELHLMHYPDGVTHHDLVVDVETERCWFASAEGEDSPATQAEALLEGAHERHVERTAPDLLAQGFCPHCQAQLYGGRLDRLLGRKEVECLVCERTWQLPPGAQLH